METQSRFVKVKNHPNWFMVLEPNQREPDGLSEKGQKQLLQATFGLLGKNDPDFIVRLKMVATSQINYEGLASKYGTLLIRPIGSFMLMRGCEVTDEKWANHFPIDNFAPIVICENDIRAEYQWVKYLERRFPNVPIATINFFSLRFEAEVAEYFKHAEYITFSTTFSDMGWFEKLTRHLTEKHKVIGYSHDISAWGDALNICKQRLEIVQDLKIGN